MDGIKKILGVVWLALAGFCGYYFLTTLGLPKLTSGKPDDLVFGIIIVFVLMPIIVGGLATFGLFAVQGEFNEENL